MRVLHVVNAWPSPEFPIRGVFIQEQIVSLAPYVDEQDTFVISGKAHAKYLTNLLRLRRCVGGYDIVHAHHVLSALLAVGAGVPRRKLVISFLNEKGKNLLRVPTWVSESLENFVARRSAACIFKNNSFKHIRREQDLVLGNAVDSDRFALRPREEARTRLGLDRDATYLLFVSANDLLRPAKRYDRFLQILDELAARKQLVRPLCLVNEPRENVPWYFAAADALIVCAEHEGSPNSVKEALASGVPVVSTDVGDVRDQISGVPGSRVLTEFSPGEFTDAVVSAISDATPRAVRREAYLQRAPGKESVAQRLAATYAAVTG